MTEKPSIPFLYRTEKMNKILTLDSRVFEPCHARVETEWSWAKFKTRKFLVHLKKDTFEWQVKPISSAETPEFSNFQKLQQLGLKIDKTNALINKLSKNVATKKDLKRTEGLLLKNQKELQTALKKHMADFKRVFEKDIEEKVGKTKAKRFWRLLEKISVVSGTMQFAEYLAKFSIFLYENKVLQNTLPPILKMIVG
jgi:hypothetical protein